MMKLLILLGLIGAALSIPVYDWDIRNAEFVDPIDRPLANYLKNAPRKRFPLYHKDWQKSIGKVDNNWRLTREVLPVSYNVRLLPFIEVGNFTIDGFVEIEIRCDTPTVNITLTSIDIDLDYSSITVVTSSNQPVAVADVTEDIAYHKVTIQTQEPLVQGSTYVVSIKFISYLNNELRGFYRSSYVEDGIRKWLGVTQFEVAGARRAFPCFDDPSMKAVFNITLGRKDTMRAVSNMPLMRTSPIDGLPGYVWDTFEPSVKMSIYLVAFLVSEYDFYESDPAASQTQFRTWGRPDIRNYLEYVASISPGVSEYYESNFGIDYALSKQDQAGIPPLDYPAGAMENWGLITYNELYYIYNPARTTALTKQEIAEVVAHEIAHQWTGNLVTMEWWSVIWLNEGFATYYQHFGTDAVEPTFMEQELFVLNSLQYVFVIDSVPNSRPLYTEVSSPLESAAVFDSIAYEKGGCVIRMMAGFLGRDTFNRAMNLYLNRNAYDNVGQDDLFQAMTDQAATENINLPASVKTIMDPWTFQNGYPLINITRDYATGSATASQRRFLRVPTNETSTHSWWVPLSYTSAANSAPSWAWIPENSPSIAISNLGAASNQWVLFNVDQTGYYRVAYDPTNYVLLGGQLVADHTRFSVQSRAALLDDAFTLAGLNLISYSDAFELTLYLSNEQAYVPWHSFLPDIEYIRSMLVNNADWRRYMSARIGPFYNHVGFVELPNDPHLRILSRTDAIDWACNLDVPQCAQDAAERYALWTTAPPDAEIFSRNQRVLSLCVGLANTDEAGWDFALEQFLDPSSANKGAIADALGCTKNPTLQTRLLNLMVNRTVGITTSDASSFFNTLADNPTANRRAFEFLRDRWDDLAAGFTPNLSNWFRRVTQTHNTPEQLAEAIALRDQHADVLGEATIAINNIQENIDWMETSGQVIISWLQQH